jgi:hypothetical protein
MMLVRQRPNRQPLNPAIAANRRELLQLDLTRQPHLRDQRSGLSGCVITVMWGQFEPSQPPRLVAKMGPNQTVTTTTAASQDWPLQAALFVEDVPDDHLSASGNQQPSM